MTNPEQKGSAMIDTTEQFIVVKGGSEDRPLWLIEDTGEIVL